MAERILTPRNHVGIVLDVKRGVEEGMRIQSGLRPDGHIVVQRIGLAIRYMPATSLFDRGLIATSTTGSRKTQRLTTKTGPEAG